MAMDRKEDGRSNRSLRRLVKPVSLRLVNTQLIIHLYTSEQKKMSQLVKTKLIIRLVKVKRRVTNKISYYLTNYSLYTSEPED